MNTGFVTLFVWVAVIGVIFAFLWYKGYLLRLTNYCQETQEELKKCTWPTVDELKGSTVVVLITIVMLGVFTIAVDFVISFLVKFITSI